MGVIVYRGYEIHTARYDCFRVPALEGDSIAPNLATAKRWIDQAIASHELKERE